MSETLRVMLVVTRLNIGGVSHQAILLGKGLQERGCDVTLVCGQEEAEEGNMFDEATAEGLRVVRVPALRRRISPFKELPAFLALRRLMRRERPHIVQTNMAKAGQLGRLAARISGVPVILHVSHGHFFHSYFDSRVTRFFALLERQMNRLVGDGLITLTDTLRRELVAYRIAPEPDITVIPSLMDFDPLQDNAHLRGDLRRELGLPPDAPLIGMVGRLVPVKNPGLFLDAAKQVRRTHPQARFVLVGDGELRPALESRAQALGIAKSVSFTGWRTDLPRIYADLDVAVVCSRNEGSPISVLEAMAAGVPVIATRVGGVLDLLEDGKTGVLTDSGDVDALAGAMSGLLEHPARAEALTGAARGAIEGRFSMDEQVNRYLAAYETVLKRKGFDPPPPLPATVGGTSSPSGAEGVSALERMVT